MITAKKFWAYEAVRVHGLTNMFNIQNVIKFARIGGGIHLTPEEVKEIAMNYREYKNKYMAERTEES